MSAEGCIAALALSEDIWLNLASWNPSLKHQRFTATLRLNTRGRGNTGSRDLQ